MGSPYEGARLRQAMDETLDAILQDRNVEVDQQANLPAAKTQIGQKLRS